MRTWMIEHWTDAPMINGMPRLTAITTDGERRRFIAKIGPNSEWTPQRNEVQQDIAMYKILEAEGLELTGYAGKVSHWRFRSDK